MRLRTQTPGPHPTTSAPLPSQVSQPEPGGQETPAPGHSPLSPLPVFALAHSTPPASRAGSPSIIAQPTIHVGFGSPSGPSLFFPALAFAVGRVGLAGPAPGSGTWESLRGEDNASGDLRALEKSCCWGHPGWDGAGIQGWLLPRTPVVLGPLLPSPHWPAAAGLVPAFPRTEGPSAQLLPAPTSSSPTRALLCSLQPGSAGLRRPPCALHPCPPCLLPVQDRGPCVSAGLWQVWERPGERQSTGHPAPPVRPQGGLVNLHFLSRSQECLCNLPPAQLACLFLSLGATARSRLSPPGSR